MTDTFGKFAHLDSEIQGLPEIFEPIRLLKTLIVNYLPIAGKLDP